MPQIIMYYLNRLLNLCTNCYENVDQAVKIKLQYYVYKLSKSVLLFFNYFSLGVSLKCLYIQYYIISIDFVFLIITYNILFEAVTFIVLNSEQFV